MAITTCLWPRSRLKKSPTIFIQPYLRRSRSCPCAASELSQMRARVYPRSAQVAAKSAGCDAHLRVVADAFGLPRIGHRVNIKDAVFLRKPHRSADANAGLTKGFQIEVFRVGELCDRVK